MKIVTMLTEKYIEGFYHFYNSFRLDNDYKLICYLINISECKEKILRKEFSDVEFKRYTGKFNAPKEKFHPKGILKVTHLKSRFIRENIKSKKDKVVWLDCSKLILGSLNFIEKELDNYEWIGVKRNTGDENKKYWAGLIAFKWGDQIYRYEKRCLEDKGNWFNDQRALTKLSGNHLDLDYYKYVSSKKDIYNPKYLLVRNLDYKNQDKFQASEKYFVEILSDRIKNYKQKYKKFKEKFPKKILAFMHHPYEDWCFLSSIKNVQKNTNLDIEICDNFTPDYLNKLNPDIVWSRGGVFLMNNFFKVRPDLKSKTITTLTHGGELLTNRIPKIMASIEGTKGILVQNQDGKIRMEHELKKRKLDIPVYLIPNMVDLNHFEPKPKPKEFTVGYIGRNNSRIARDQKGWEIFNYVKEILEGEVKVKMATNTQNKLPYEKMPEFYNSINCLILPSHSEGHSNTINEAMACGLPVISTKVGWHGENCKDRENILFCVRSVYDILNKVRYLQENPRTAHRIGTEARKFVEEHITPQKIGKQWEDLFNEII